MGKWAIGLALLFATGCGADAVELSDSANGKTESLEVDQDLDLTLHTIGPGNYGDPQLSSGAVKFLSMEYPSAQGPGGPTQIYHFEAVSAGSDVLTIPHTERDSVFTLTLKVE